MDETTTDFQAFGAMSMRIHPKNLSDDDLICLTTFCLLLVSKHPFANRITRWIEQFVAVESKRRESNDAGSIQEASIPSIPLGEFNACELAGANSFVFWALSQGRLSSKSKGLTTFFNELGIIINAAVTTRLHYPLPAKPNCDCSKPRRRDG